MASFLCGSKTEIIHGTLLLFTYSELEHATNKFSHSNLIGLGGNSYVYRGQLKDGRTVAVKQLKAQGGPDADFLFLTEVLRLLGTPFSLFIKQLLYLVSIEV